MRDKKSDMELMKNFATHLQNAINKAAEENGGNNHKLLIMHAAVLLKASVELYTIAFEEDDAIEGILHSAIESIPYVRDNSRRIPKGSDTSSNSLH